MKTILQIPLDKQLKSSAEKAASQQGFSSLQEIVRVFLAQLASNKVGVTIQEISNLSSDNEKRYLEMTKDFESDKNTYMAQSVEDLTSQLNAN